MRNSAILFLAFGIFIFDFPVALRKLTLDLSSADFGEQRYLQAGLMGAMASKAPGMGSIGKKKAAAGEPPEPLASLMEKEQTLTQGVDLLDENLTTVESLREKCKRVARFLQDMSDQINEKFDNVRARIQV